MGAIGNRACAAAIAAILLLPGAPASATGVNQAERTRSAQHLLRLTPMPRTVEMGEGAVTIGTGAGIAVPPQDRGASDAAKLLIAHVRAERGIALKIADGDARIRFIRDASISGDEAYRLTVDRTGIAIRAAGDRGFIWGAMTAAQLLSPDSRFGKPVSVPAMVIGDSPRFVWRGLLIDVARHFQPIDEVKKIVDQMASVKLNTLHLHLTDDQGWRFEVKRYPELTRIGAWRTSPGGGDRVGGFYTQDELKDLVAYAAARGITIVPEIDLPGHAQALVAAYPEMGVFGDRPEVSTAWGVNPYLINPDAEGVRFVENILDELMAVFPSTYIHLGGDEAVKDQWIRSPAVQAQMQKLGIKSENELQSWLIDRFGEYLASKGRRLIGWDEILEGGLPASASVMSWRGEDGAIQAANAGHDVVLSPSPTLYFDGLQSDAGDEPPGRIKVKTLADIYAYDPMPHEIDPALRSHVLGAQANAWSEYLVTPQQMEHKIFPRIGALAENVWSPAGNRDFAGFVDRLMPQIARWKRGGIAVADSAFAVRFALAGSRGEALRNNRATVALASQTGQGTIRYTLDGSEPDAKSKSYRAPLTLKPGATIRAAAFDARGGAVSAVRSYDTSRSALLRYGNSDLVACPKGSFLLRVPLSPDATANGPAYNMDLFYQCSAARAVPLDQARGVEVTVARMKIAFGLAHQFDDVVRQYDVTSHGELVVEAKCFAPDGSAASDPVVLATFPLPDPETADNRMTFRADIPQMKGDEDVCFRFTSQPHGQRYAVESVSFVERSK
ncbi:beta-N-acetylhexosaminidase [Stakelama pacifica]|uniref:beta-N-acetylhexosaminidase n=1 Tax=Stakelama pacifica TaxID=517720 RepID=A0A4R6FII8_9SPHN|nr:family 20 glycosylhydrolase [Stakelama pacifica]TDN80315.1 hexosaminidase [Stakelama pacifica]